MTLGLHCCGSSAVCWLPFPLNCNQFLHCLSEPYVNWDDHRRGRKVWEYLRGREGGREGEREGERGREGGREGGKEGREGGKEGREGGKEGREGRRGGARGREGRERGRGEREGGGKEGEGEGRRGLRRRIEGGGRGWTVGKKTKGYVCYQECTMSSSWAPDAMMNSKSVTCTAYQSWVSNQVGHLSPNGQQLYTHKSRNGSTHAHMLVPTVPSEG